jgi:mono/diheme cytochrome c family protein
VGDAVAGEQLFQSTCAACHGRRGEGIAKQGLPLRTSTFVKERDDQALLAFIKIGRQPFDPANTTGVGMPPRGGNPIFTDDKILDTIAYVRVLQEEAASEAPSDSAAATIEAGEASGAAAEEEGFWIPKSVVPRAAVGPSGIAPVEPAVVHHQLVQEAGHQFFGIYFLLTGLHGLHVIIGMIVIGWLLVRAIRGDFGVNYFGPVDLGGLYWHLVDVIWIFLFPLLYLI